MKTKLILPFLFVMFFISCGGKKNIQKLPTITDLSKLQELKKAIYQAPNGKSYVLSYEADDNTSESDEVPVDTGAFLNSKSASDNKNCDAVGCPKNCNFDGKKRADAKTTISNGPLIKYENVSGFLSSFADKHPDTDMNEVINGSDERVELEDFNVEIKKAWLFCFAKETDEDYHLVVGTLKNIDDPKNRFMIIEISGLPETGEDRQLLKEVQNDFFSIIGDRICTGGYYWYDEGKSPIQITFSGSVYWDTEHWGKNTNEMGKHGPESLRDRLTTVWELHPVTMIKEI